MDAQTDSRSAGMERQHGEVDFYLTQFLTGHGYFRGLLKEWKKVATRQCLHCPGEKDTVEHTFLGCVRYSEGHLLSRKCYGVPKTGKK